MDGETVMRLSLADGMPYRDENYDYVFVCGKCGHETLGLPHYCPGCGRKANAEASDKRPD